MSEADYFQQRINQAYDDEGSSMDDISKLSAEYRRRFPRKYRIEKNSNILFAIVKVNDATDECSVTLEDGLPHKA